MYCKNCGNELKDSDRFCDQCGSSVDNEKKRGNYKFVLIVVLLVLVIAGAGGIAFFALKNDSEPKSDEIKSADNTNLTEDAKTGDTDDSDNIEDINDTEDIDDASYLAWVRDDSGRYGYVSKTGEEIVPCRYDSAEDFEYGFARVGIENGVDEDGKTIYRYGYVNAKGEEVVPCIYDTVGILEESKLFDVRKDDTAWLLDQNGEEIMPDKFEYIWWGLGKTGLIVIEKNGKYGCINLWGEEIIPAIYDEGIFYLEESDLIMVQKGKFSDVGSPQYGLFDGKGKEIVPLQGHRFSDYYISESGLFLIEKDGKYGFVDYEGNAIVPIIYDHASEYGRNGLAIVNKGYNTFLIDKTGTIKYECKNTYERAYAFDDCGLAVVCSEDGQYGAINEAGEEVIPCIYDDIWLEFTSTGKKYCFDHHNLAKVKKNDKYGVINEFGEEILPLEYDLASILIFDNGVIRVEKDELYGAKSSRGETILPLEYDDIMSAQMDRGYGWAYDIRNFGPLIIASKNSKNGLFDETGNEIIPCIYESFDNADEKGYFVAYLEEDQKSPVLLTIEGKEIVPKGYDYIGVTDGYNNDVSFPAFGDDDLIPVSKQGQCSYLDRSGNEIMQLSNKYTRAGRFVRIP